jgi:threonine dehydrogenase-like Zn-dependent dehydrogenase
VETADSKHRHEQVLALTGGRGADIVIEASGAKMAFREGVDMVRRGGRYLAIGQTNTYEIPFVPSAVVGREMAVFGSLSAETTDYYRAMEFMRNNYKRFDFDAMVTARYPLSKINDAYSAMIAFKDIKSVILPQE